MFVLDGESYITVISNGTDDVIALVDLRSTSDSLKSSQVLVPSVLLKVSILP